MTSKIDTLLNKINIEMVFLIFFILQPFVEIYRAFFEDTVSIGPIALEQIINILFAIFFFVVCAYKIFKEKKKNKIIFYSLYCISLVIYMIFHYINVNKFDRSIYSESDINIITEFYFIIRAYIMPIIIMICIYELGMSNKTFINIVKIVTFTISACIVITNIFGVSLVSYSLELEKIKGGIFSWLSLSSSQNDLEAYTSKGWFYSANQISALLFSLAPIIVYEMIKNTNWKTTGLLLLQMTAMIMVGTKTSAMGVLLVCIAMLIYSIGLKILKWDNIKNWIFIPTLIVIIIGGFALYNISPGRLRYGNFVKVEQEEREEAEEKPGETILTEVAALEKYVKENYYYYYISEDFIPMYPVKDDPEFWGELLSRDRNLNRDNRKLKIDVLNRIMERNNNKADVLLGMGYTSNIPDAERDYVYQYYIFGIIGLILLIGPFIGILVYSGIKMLIKYKEKMNLQNGAIIMSLSCLCIIAYLSGHVFGKSINMLFLSLYGAILLLNINGKNKENMEE